ETPVINGDGEQTRDYVFVGDVIEANCSSLKSDLKGTYNIGTGVETTVNRIYSILSRLAGNDRVEHGPAKAGEQRLSVISPELAKQTFGWKPTVALEDGLKKTFEWFRESNQIRH